MPITEYVPGKYFYSDKGTLGFDLTQIDRLYRQSPSPIYIVTFDSATDKPLTLARLLIDKWSQHPQFDRQDYVLMVWIKDTDAIAVVAGNGLKDRSIRETELLKAARTGLETSPQNAVIELFRAVQGNRTKQLLQVNEILVDSDKGANLASTDYFSPYFWLGFLGPLVLGLIFMGFGWSVLYVRQSVRKISRERFEASLECDLLSESEEENFDLKESQEREWKLLQERYRRIR